MGHYSDFCKDCCKHDDACKCSPAKAPTNFCKCGNVLANELSKQTGVCINCRSAAAVGLPPLPVPRDLLTADATKEGRKIGKVRMDLVMQDMPRAI